MGIQGDGDWDLLSAIWVLSANDENPIITFKGLVARLGLLDEERVRTLVRSRRELFRLGVLETRLAAWKEELKKGRRMPVWIAEISDIEKRNAEVDRLTANDVFRNQFRIEEGAKKCAIATIDWGLQYVERMRKAAADRRQERRVWWSTSLSIASVCITVITLAATTWFQNRSIETQSHSIDTQTELKKYEVTFKPRQEAYANLISSLGETIVATIQRNQEQLAPSLARVYNQLLGMTIFLRDDTAIDLMNKYSVFARYCQSQVRLPASTGDAELQELMRQMVSFSLGVRVVLFLDRDRDLILPPAAPTR